MATPPGAGTRVRAAQNRGRFIIKDELARGKHLILTPGVYDLAASIGVKNPDTVVLGLGHATLTAVDGAVPLTVADVPGVMVAGITIDAGAVESPVLLQVGAPAQAKVARSSDPHNPTTLSDVYFRVGGPHVGKAGIALEVNSDNVLIDHARVWRADHGVEGFTGGVNGDDQRWTKNIGRNGVVVNNPGIHTENGLEAPQTLGVQLHHIRTVNLSAGTIDSVVNGVGGAVDPSLVGRPAYLTTYPLP